MEQVCLFLVITLRNEVQMLFSIWTGRRDQNVICAPRRYFYSQRRFPLAPCVQHATNVKYVHPSLYSRMTFCPRIPFTIFALLLFLSVVVTQIRGRTAGSSPSLLTTVCALHFYRERKSALSSLADSRRIVLTHTINRRSQQIFFFLQIGSKYHHGGIRTHGPTP